MMNATTYGVLYGVLILLLTCLQYYIRIIKPEKIARKYMQEYIELKKYVDANVLEYIKANSLYKHK